MESKYIYEESLSGKDYSDKPLAKGEYEYCTFKNCNFLNADLSEIRFLETKFFDCDLSNSNLTKTSFQNVLFKDCKMLGLQFVRCNDFGLSVTFESCQLNHSTFYQMKLSKFSFYDSKLQGVDFGETELKNVSLQKCDFLNSIFENTNLVNADLRNSINYSIDPENNRVKGAKFSLPEVVGLLNKYNIKIDTE